MADVRKSGRAPAPDGFKYVPPDGGFGWCVLVGTCLAGAIALIPLTSFGFFLADILHSMQTSASTCSWIPSICVSVSMLIAPVVNIVITKYSCRTATIIGGVLESVGMILSYFATNVEVLFLTFGVIYGAGLGFVTSSTVLVLSEYFRDHYGLVTGISYASSAAGRLIFSPIVQYMLEIMDYHSLLLVLGALCLNVCVGGSLYQPSIWHQKLVPISSLELEVINKKVVDPISPIPSTKINPTPVTENEKNLIAKEGSSDSPDHNRTLHSRQSPRDENQEPSAVCLLKSEETLKAEVITASLIDIFGSIQSVTVHEEPEEGKAMSDEPQQVKAGCYSWWKNGPLKLDIKLLTEPIFHVLMWGTMLASVVTVYQGVFMPSLMVENGLLPMEAATAMSFKAGGELIGRAFTPYLKELLKIPLLPLCFGLVLFQVGSLILITFMTSYASVVVVVVLGGFSNGGYTGLLMLVMVDSVGYGRLSSIFALTRFLQGILLLGVGPLIGFVKDLVGAYDVCYYILSVIQFVCFLAWLLQPLAKRKSFDADANL